MSAKTYFADKGWLLMRSHLTTPTISALRQTASQGGAGKRLNHMIGAPMPSEFMSELENLAVMPVIRRAVAFSKSGDRNWSLPWHQDRVVTMAERSDDPTLTNWSKKDGVWHCEPSVERLQFMAFLYIALDPTGETGGGLEIAEGTHSFGKIEAQDVEAIAQSATQVQPELELGQALLVHALTLHRSGRMHPGAIARRAVRLDLEFIKLADFQ